MSEEITVHHQPNIETPEGNKRTCASLSYIYILSSIAPPPGGGGTQTKFYTGRLYPKVHPLTLLKTIFDRKGTPVVYLLLNNGTLFTYLSLEHWIPFN